MAERSKALDCKSSLFEFARSNRASSISKDYHLVSEHRTNELSSEQKVRKGAWYFEKAMAIINKAKFKKSSPISDIWTRRLLQGWEITYRIEKRQQPSYTSWMYNRRKANIGIIYYAFGFMNKRVFNNSRFIT